MLYINLLSVYLLRRKVKLSEVNKLSLKLYNLKALREAFKKNYVS